MKREIYEFEENSEEKLRHTKTIFCVEIDINNYAKVTKTLMHGYDAKPEEQQPPTVSSTVNVFIGKVESIEDLIKLLQPYYPNLVKENLTLLSSVAWTDWNYKPE